MHALPDIEIMYCDSANLSDGDAWQDEDGEPLQPGWYWWSCFPGCLPDGDPIGPFASGTEALADARDRLNRTLQQNILASIAFYD